MSDNISDKNTNIQHTKPSLYEKIQAVRVGLSKLSLKKSGKNSYSKFSYFELGDFLCELNQLIYDNRFFTKIDFEQGGVDVNGLVSSGRAIIEAIDWDSDVRVCISCPLVNAEMKGSQAIQQLGATQTYLRRYLYMLMFDIAENDMVDESAGKQPQNDNGKRKNKVVSEKITALQKETLIKLGLNGDVDFEKLAGYAGVDSIDSIPFDVAEMQIVKLAKQKDVDISEYFESV